MQIWANRDLTFIAIWRAVEGLDCRLINSRNLTSANLLLLLLSLFFASASLRQLLLWTLLDLGATPLDARMPEEAFLRSKIL